jgi:hypothetical protein
MAAAVEGALPRLQSNVHRVRSMNGQLIFVASIVAKSGRRTEIAVLEKQISQLVSVNADLRAQLKSAQAEIQQEALQRGSLDDDTVHLIQAMA